MKKRIIFPVLIICIIVAAAGLMLFRMRGGVKVMPTEEQSAFAKVISYRQDDPAWAKDLLGKSEYTMKSSGCLVSCIASAVSDDNVTITPGELNKLFSDNEVYDVNGNLQWYKLAEIEGYSVAVYNEVNEADIEQCLSDGHYPIVRVRMHGVGNYHYVLIVGKEDGKYICMDPLEDDLTKLSAYGNTVYAVRCVWKEK